MPYSCDCDGCEGGEAVYWVLDGRTITAGLIYSALEYQMFRHDTAVELGWFMICAHCLQNHYEGGYLNSESYEEHEGEYLDSSAEGHEWWKRPILEEIDLDD